MTAWHCALGGSGRRGVGGDWCHAEERRGELEGDWYHNGSRREGGSDWRCAGEKCGGEMTAWIRAGEKGGEVCIAVLEADVSE